MHDYYDHLHISISAAPQTLSLLLFPLLLEHSFLIPFCIFPPSFQRSVPEVTLLPCAGNMTQRGRTLPRVRFRNAMIPSSRGAEALSLDQGCSKALRSSSAAPGWAASCPLRTAVSALLHSPALLFLWPPPSSSFMAITGSKGEKINRGY